ncbi:Pre-mRNA-splicing factor cwf19 [Coemansia sp. RSA 1722]|nr:Pre-mRNA-splicing factor cwf19 [Coemansia sp. RSA 1722]
MHRKSGTGLPRTRSRSPERKQRSRAYSKGKEARDNSSSSHVRVQNDDLNKLRARVMKARLLKSADLPELEKKLSAAMDGGVSRSHEDKPSKESNTGSVVILPRVDSYGRLSKIAAESASKHTGGLRNDDKAQAESQDNMSIQQMARMERESVGDDYMGRALAKQIAKDAAFTNDLDYIDDNSERLSRQLKEKTFEQQKQAAIRDHHSMESVLDHCGLCFKEKEQRDGSKVLSPPEYPVVSLGNKVYLALPNCEPMNDGHCVIAPIEHVAGSSLKCDDDVWDEIGNFMKRLIQMFASKNQGVVFLETVMSTTPSKARHCSIECIPLPIQKAADAPAYFKEALLEVDEEWSQHRKIIDTKLKAQAAVPKGDNVRDQDSNHAQAREIIRKGGFRNTMTAKMPYFHVWFDPYGGMGHVIENADRFKPWFGREVVAGILDLPPSVYRKPRRLKETHNQRLDRADDWKKQFGWEKYDWTKMLQ